MMSGRNVPLQRTAKLCRGQTEGFVKIVADKQYGEVLGIHIVGPNATDLMRRQMLCSWKYAVRPSRNSASHPTLSEAVMEAAHGPWPAYRSQR